MKTYLLILTIAAASFACGSAPVSNTNTAANSNSNSNSAVVLDPANMPDGLKPQAIPPSANTTPGIPPTVTNLPKGATPTPGIPDPATIKKGMKPGVTPTPGIPSQEEIRKALGQKSNANQPPPGNNQMMMKKNANKIQRPR